MNESEDSLIARAVSGDGLALGRLLVTYHDRLAARIARKFPAFLKGSLEVDDVLQKAYLGASRNVRTFQPRGPEAFYRWLAVIADHRLQDAVKAHTRAKRPSQKRVPGPVATLEGSSILDWVDLVADRGPTPSKAPAQREAIQAMQVALAGLPPHYREALQLRYFNGHGVAEVAARMGRKPGAVLMLCNRGLKKLRERMGRSSLYLSSR